MEHLEKILDISLAKKYGWTAKTNLETGFDKTYEDFLKKNFTFRNNLILNKNYDQKISFS